MSKKMSNEMILLIDFIDKIDDELYLCVDEPMPYVVRRWIGGKVRCVVNSKGVLEFIPCEHIKQYDDRCLDCYNKTVKSLLVNSAPYGSDPFENFYKVYKSFHKSKDDYYTRKLCYINYNGDDNVVRFVSVGDLEIQSIPCELTLIAETKNTIRILKTLCTIFNSICSYNLSSYDSFSTSWLVVDDIKQRSIDIKAFSNKNRKSNCIIS